MDAQFKTHSTINPLDILNLKQEYDDGFELIAFTFNSDKHCYDYIFKKITDLSADYKDASTPEKDYSPVQTPSRFMFKNALVGLGVEPQTAADWIKVRQAKKAAQTETAFRTVESQINIIKETYGVTANDIIRVAVERNWQGVMARYFENIDWSEYRIEVGHTDLPFDNQKWE